jgi:hypothetical protein
LTLVLCFSCGEDFDIKKSIFREDPDNPGLPEYSELGYNTFGAYYDWAAFTSNDLDVPLKVVVKDGTASFSFHGDRGSSTSEMAIKFSFANNAATYQDLLALNDFTVNLNDPSSQVIISVDNFEHEATILNGELKFKKVRNLLVDEQETGVILSGTFQFQALINQEPTFVTSGRFDILVGSDNFFSF